MSEPRDIFWGVPAADVLRQLDATPQGLATAEAGRRLDRVGPNVLQPRKRSGELVLLLGQFKSPLILILLFAAGLSFFLHDSADALIIFVIVILLAASWRLLSFGFRPSPTGAAATPGIEYSDKAID